MPDLREIFGIGLYGHFFAAKKVAEKIGSQFNERSSAALLPGNAKTR